MKIYSRRGDHGQTSLTNGKRVSKASLRVDVYGEVDELNAVVGLARVNVGHPELRKALDEIQRDLFSIGALLADPEGRRKVAKVSLGTGDVDRLERHIDRFDSELPTLSRFILPGGASGGALLHQARALCRRAERKLAALSESELVSPSITAYLNRLSDLLFVSARLENRHQGVEEVMW
jgi:cob(I)alamin adenosyltransferase